MEQNSVHPYYVLRNEEYKQHIEKKGKFDYLSWAVAWDKLKQMSPDAKYEIVTYQTANGNKLPYMRCDKGALVHIYLQYKDKNDDIHKHEEYLAVTDHRNQCVLEPDSVQVINTARRCLAKAISMATGWGIELWFGEDIKSLDYQPQTLFNGDLPTKGKVTVDQNVKLRRLANNRVFKDSDMVKQVDIFIIDGPTEKQAENKIKKLEQAIKENK
jgi:hypothetical protein|tara:strand:- start:10942 stop:11583 length:642 start_codon:yes stop_codon:yes gene_type:complete